jgi:ADP-ribose pyrophosphatase YjhB (NUDIX family)
MRQAARAIIIEGAHILVMKRNKQGSEYFTLVGGRVDDTETIEQALVREVKEETGLDVIAAQLMFFEPHPAPYNEQSIFLCQVAPHGLVAIQATSEEALMNRIAIDTHQPLWIELKAFAHIPFRSIQLQNAIVEAFQKGFPAEVIKL